MKKQKLVAAPTSIQIGVTAVEVAADLRVVDATTGETIAAVLAADAAAGTVRRHKVEDGNLVREDNAYAIVEEARAIRIEWIEQPVDEDPLPIGDTGAQQLPTEGDA